MSANPFKFLGGMVLEIAAVVAVLAMLPTFSSTFFWSGEPQATSLSQLPEVTPNQVFFDARSARKFDLGSSQSTPPAVWASDFARPVSPQQQRFVEGVLDHNSQRAMDVASRVWERGDAMLPADLRVQRQAANEIPRLAPPRNEAVRNYATNYDASRELPLNDLDRGQLVELPSAQPVRANDYQDRHPSFAETYQRPAPSNYSANNYAANSLPASNYAAPALQPVRPATSSYATNNTYAGSYNQSSYNQHNYAQSPAPAVNNGSSYYGRSPAIQAAEPHIRRYDERY
ncbi:hypothetical protein NA78x_005854 [Anatilimnocola sp. NA78]|uniref:hypothetical protein n=1 Tax=Anatilimnocola sp. NA78 TaxID=3415683 RepID=UPI003CE55565